ncbi:hypothetical protein KGM_215682 [Danaus plexippus plexippus]|uniref:Uncharacterized protein n=1 Tax=Danaus plexippus plexippus TaxID=278856 RepID=A0A212EVI9_DANPL|nr:hypothetical protein KGM_215682 [Danaus plexippus plexippus]
MTPSPARAGGAGRAVRGAGGERRGDVASPVANSLLPVPAGRQSLLERGTDRVDPLRSGHLFCGDIDGVPLGQRGVLPGSTQINRLVQDAAHGAEPEPMLGANDARTPTTALYTPPL